MSALAQKSDTTGWQKKLHLVGISCGAALPMHDFSSRNAKFCSVTTNGNTGFYDAGALAKPGIGVNADYSFMGYTGPKTSIAFSATLGYYYNPFDMNTFMECAKNSYQLENSPEEWTTTSSSYSGGYTLTTAMVGFRSGIEIQRLSIDCGVYGGIAHLSAPGVSYTANLYYPALYTYSIPINYSITSSSSYAVCLDAFFGLRYKLSNKVYAMADASFIGTHFTNKVTYTNLSTTNSGTISIHYLQSLCSLGIEFKLGK